jgi:hypothetical protein
MTSFISPLTNCKRQKADTIRKTRFFHVIDEKFSEIIIKNVCEKKKISHFTNKYWLRQRKLLDNIETCRRTSKHRSERSKKMNAEMMNEMLDVSNSVRDQSYVCQIEHFNLDVASRTLQVSFNQRKSRVSRYKKAWIKIISSKNRELRVQYAKEHKNHTIENFWQHVHFTDEAHFDFDQMFQQRILREENTRYESKNMQTVSDMKNVKLHVAAFISWHHKEALQFYNDEHDKFDIQIKKSLKSRKSKKRTEKEYRQLMMQWKTSLSHDVEIKSKNNNMTQIYYTERLLFVYAQEIHECRMNDRFCILQEDNDSSHDTRSQINVVRSYKADNWFTTLIHSSQSSDLDSSKNCWNILKQRVKRRSCKNLTKLKAIILKEWKKIFMNEIRNRIREMPDRCKKLIETKDQAIKSSLW